MWPVKTALAARVPVCRGAMKTAKASASKMASTSTRRNASSAAPRLIAHAAASAEREAVADAWDPQLRVASSAKAALAAAAVLAACAAAALPPPTASTEAASSASVKGASYDDPPPVDSDPCPIDAVAAGLAVTGCYTANSPVEDRHVVRCCASGDVVVAVFDGHGGWQAAEFAQRRMAATVQQELQNVSVVSAKSTGSDAAGAEAGAAGAGATTPEQVVGALRRAFMRVDREFIYQVKAAFDLGFGDVAKTGACALVALIRDGALFVANAGDCRAVLGRSRAGGSPGTSSAEDAQGASSSDGAGLEAVALSFDHNAREEREQAKLRALHPMEDDIIRCKRPSVCYVKGRLQPTRALGDAYLKYSEFNGLPGMHNRRGRYLPPPYAPPYITAEPEVVVHQIDLATDQFVVMGSDGLWDYLSNEEAVEVVAAAVEGGGRGGAGQQLVARVLEKAAEHHALSLDALRGLKAGPDRRRRHDDVTAIVVFLDGSMCSGSAPVSKQAAAAAQ